MGNKGDAIPWSISNITWCYFGCIINVLFLPAFLDGFDPHDDESNMAAGADVITNPAGNNQRTDQGWLTSLDAYCLPSFFVKC